MPVHVLLTRLQAAPTDLSLLPVLQPPNYL